MCKSKEEFKNVLIDRIPSLIKELGNVSTEYAYERKYIGEAITYLRHLHSILEVSSASGVPAVPASPDLKGLKAHPAMPEHPMFFKVGDGVFQNQGNSNVMPCGNSEGCTKCGV
jgi:hypothetical protein